MVFWLFLGRSRQIGTKKVVAIKVIDIDEADFRAYGEAKDEQMKDFNREIKILRQAKDSGARIIHMYLESTFLHCVSFWADLSPLSPF